MAEAGPGAGASLFMLSGLLLGVRAFVMEEGQAFEDAVMASDTAAQRLISDGMNRG